MRQREGIVHGPIQTARVAAGGSACVWAERGKPRREAGGDRTMSARPGSEPAHPAGTDRRPALLPRLGRWGRGRSLRLLVLLAALVAPVSPVAQGTEPPFQATARSIIGADQGVFAVAEDGAILAAFQVDRPVHPASVTKVATTLALLRQLGPAYRFETALVAEGPVQEGTLHGNLLVRAGRDPFLVSENAFVMLLELHAMGIHRLDGALQVEGPLVFNWRPDPTGSALRRTLAGLDGAAAWKAVQAQRADAAAVDRAAIGLEFRRGGGGSVPAAVARGTLLVHRSPPLRRIVKELNCYSNNVFHLLSEHIGGPAAIERAAREDVGPELHSAVRITNAAGAGKTNRMSPRAAVTLVQALQRELGSHGLSLVDVLPVAGVDRGSLAERLDDPAYRGAVVGKTGTFGSLGASALAGVARTRRYGEVTFAVLNRGLPVPDARRRQDAFLAALLDASGARPWPYRPPLAPPFTEAQIEVVP